MAAAVAALPSGCSVDELDLGNKACPCVDGWTCDASRNICVAGSGTGGAGVGGGGGAGAGVPGAVIVTDLRVTWTTPNWIRWEWDLDGVPDQLLGFELVTGESEEDVTSRSGTAVVWTADENPELGRYFLPATGSEDPVVATMTDLHDADTQYFGQLTATDTANRTTVTNLAGGRTTNLPSHSFVIFDDTATPGYSIPGSFVLSDVAPHAGTHHYDYLSSCVGGDVICWETVRRQDLGMDISAISEGAFSTTAYLEMAVAAGGPAPSYWSQLRIMMGTSGDHSTYLLPAWTIRADGAYRVYQMPLRALADSNGPMPHTEMSRALYEFGIGGSWVNDTHTRVDEIRVHW
ncbi:MAG: hypothetical protein DRI90_05910 [Deltaproteobacteria bacterium]|nr:MAG: hypothetical protein DRI90_05910 [Deltaproteobacteria bacterium]